MNRPLLLLLALLCSSPLSAQGRLYSDSFEQSAARPLFPYVGGTFQLPAGPATNQLTWLLGELQSGETTTEAEVNAHFDAAWLATTNAAATVTFINSVRNAYPNAQLVDVISVSPIRVTALIDSPSAPGAPFGFFVFGARYTGSQRIVQFGVSGFNSVQFPADQALALPQAADKFATLSSAPGLFIGRVRPDGTCETLVERQSTQLRATASIFKTWMLGGVARAVANNTLTASTSIPMVASELAPGGLINVEPVNTPFPAGDLAILMMGNSDNTATDLLHQQVGRPVINQVVSDYAMSQPTVLTPLLGISEQFHVFRSFDLATANSYVNGTESFQQNFLDNSIVPLGPCCTGPTFHTELLTAGTWRATAVDVCRAFAGLRRTAQGSDAFDVVDRAMGAQVAQPGVRNFWDRAWYKGGSLAAGNPVQFRVLTHAWLLEDAGRDPFVVVAMSNSPSTDPNAPGIDQFNVQSVLGRILQLVDQLP